MFNGFETLAVETPQVRFSGVMGGKGPALLLLHGYPQTHLTWRFVAPALIENYTVVVPDLPGYGDSEIVERDGPRWTKRRVAAALAAMMDVLGHDRFTVIGHDRGARVGYRMALDFAARVAGYASVTVIPTYDVWQTVDMGFGMGAFHWFMLAQEHDLPERLLASDPDAFIDAALKGMAGSLDRFEPEVLERYRAAFRKPSVRHAICEDYRSAAKEDLAHDTFDKETGHKLACPVMVLWPQSRSDHGKTPLEVWRGWADDVTGAAISGGHLLQEFSSADVIENLLPFVERVAR